MGIYDDLMSQVEEKKRQTAVSALDLYKSQVTSGQTSYDKDVITQLSEAGGVNTPSPTAMPLPPDMTRSADRQSAARRRRRGRSSTMLTSTLGEETLGG